MMRHSERWIYVSKAATLDDVDLTPTEAMRAAAKRGLELRQEAPKSRKGGLDTKQAGAQGIGSGVARSRDILSGKALSEKVVRQMHAFFSRHAAFKHKHKEEPEGKAIQSWLLWGGDAGEAWSKRKVDEMNRLRDSETIEKAARSVKYKHRKFGGYDNKGRKRWIYYYDDPKKNKGAAKSELHALKGRMHVGDSFSYEGGRIEIVGIEGNRVQYKGADGNLHGAYTETLQMRLADEHRASIEAAIVDGYKKRKAVSEAANKHGSEKQKARAKALLDGWLDSYGMSDSEMQEAIREMEGGGDAAPRAEEPAPTSAPKAKKEKKPKKQVAPESEAKQESPKEEPAKTEEPKESAPAPKESAPAPKESAPAPKAEESVQTPTPYTVDGVKQHFAEQIQKAKAGGEVAPIKIKRYRSQAQEVPSAKEVAAREGVEVVGEGKNGKVFVDKGPPPRALKYGTVGHGEIECGLLAASLGVGPKVYGGMPNMYVGTVNGTLGYIFPSSWKEGGNLSMELLENHKTLHQHMVSLNINEDWVAPSAGDKDKRVRLADFSLQRLSILRNFHLAGYSHNDAHSNNFLVGPDGTLRLIDYGLAQKGYVKAVEELLDIRTRQLVRGIQNGIPSVGNALASATSALKREVDRAKGGMTEASAIQAIGRYYAALDRALEAEAKK